MGAWGSGSIGVLASALLSTQGGRISASPSEIGFFEGPAENNSLKEFTRLAIFGLGGRIAFWVWDEFLGKLTKNTKKTREKNVRDKGEM